MDFLGKTLEELWISYNEIEKIEHLKCLVNLKKLYIGCNLIKSIDELQFLVRLFIYSPNPLVKFTIGRCCL
jgi:Leucine-rich repeat (LRR) protein